MSISNKLFILSAIAVVISGFSSLKFDTANHASKILPNMLNGKVSILCQGIDD